MTMDEIRDLLLKVKSIYPRFESVEKNREGWMQASDETVKAWHEQIGWMSPEEAQRILDQHMDSDKGEKPPTLRTWIMAGRARQGSGTITATLDRRNGVIIWEPEEGKGYEIPATWDERRGVWHRADGYEYITQEEAGG